MKKVTIVSATKKNQLEFFENAPLSFFLKKFVSIGNKEFDIDFHIEYENKAGLGIIYNKYIKMFNDNRILVFVHDDVFIEDAFFCEKLNSAVEHFDIVGLAGTKKYSLSSPAVWHNSPKDAFTGAVAHFHQNKTWMTCFGTMPSKCLIVDGLFMAINLETVKAKNLLFDEQFLFHHYDMDFCLQAFNKVLITGTWPIWVTHCSIGEYRNDKIWYESEKLFINKWRKK